MVRRKIESPLSQTSVFINLATTSKLILLAKATREKKTRRNLIVTNIKLIAYAKYHFYELATFFNTHYAA